MYSGRDNIMFYIDVIYLPYIKGSVYIGMGGMVKKPCLQGLNYLRSIKKLYYILYIVLYIVVLPLCVEAETSQNC